MKLLLHRVRTCACFSGLLTCAWMTLWAIGVGGTVLTVAHAQPAHPSDATYEAGRLAWRSLPDALDASSEAPILVYVHAPWCGPCRKLERDVFPEVRPLLQRFTRAHLDFDDTEGSLRLGSVSKSPFDWARHFGIDTTPGLIFLDARGTVITTMTGAMNAESLQYLLAFVVTGAHQHTDFKTYLETTTRSPGADAPN